MSYPPSDLIASSTTRSTCPYCGVGCGVLGEVANGQLLGVRGDPAHPANQGRLCVKGAALHETLGREGRLLHPLVNGERVSWDSALDTVAKRLSATVREHGPGAVAFYLSGQLLTEDYYVANKLMKGFIGSANVDTNSRLCMASATAAQQRAFGEDIVPACYEDLELADLVLLVGSNTAYAHPVAYQRIMGARERDPAKRIVVLDPRRTATCERADLHLALRPGSDSYYFNGLLVYLAEHQGLDQRFLARHCQGFAETLAAARKHAGSLAQVARICDLPEAELETSYAWFCETPRALTLFSQGINQSTSGVDQGTAIINCHLASGKIGKPGAAPFSITGQPNAMGGREVGGLATQLAAHIGFDKAELIDLVAAFWNAPHIARQPGLKAVDLFAAIGRGEVKMVWIMATNPVVSMPDADRVRAALEACEFVVVSDCYRRNDTLALADVCLPAAGWPEKTGMVTNSERRISLQKALLPALGEAWPDWKIVCEVARRLGHGEAFDYAHPADIFREHAALSGFGNAGERAFDISGLAGISHSEYEAFQPTQWPLNREWPQGRARLFEEGRFYSHDGRAQLLPVHPRPVPEAGADTWLLNTGRLRDQWHSMTRSGRSPRLMSHRPEPCLDLHPEDAAQLGLRERDLAEVSSSRGSVLLRVALDRAQRRGEAFAAIHWNDEFSAMARVCVLVPPDTDPVSGQPAFKQTPVRIRRFAADWRGVLLCRRDWQPNTRYWTRVTINGGARRYYLADNGQLPANADGLKAQFAEVDDWVELRDSGQQHYRLAGFRDDRLEVLLLCSVGSAPAPETGWQETQLGQAAGEASRFLLLSGRGPVQDSGPIVCACYQVAQRRIEQALREGCASAEDLGRKLRCGTNCGSCLPELRALVETSLLAGSAG